MVDRREPFFLFIGHGDSEAATSKLSTSSIRYEKKMLESNPENWFTIDEILQDPDLLGALVKLTKNTCRMLVSDEYAEPAGRILGSLSKMRHVVFMHESVLADPADWIKKLEASVEAEDGYHELWEKFYNEESWNQGKLMDALTEQESSAMTWLIYGQRTLIEPEVLLSDARSHIPAILEKMKKCLILPPEARLQVRDIIVRNNLNLVLYQRVAEWSVAATAFIEDNDKRLLFRVYVPSGRVFAAEAEKLFALFCDWLSRVKGRRIRQGGYKTKQGQVYEFYGDSELAGQNLSRELNEFSKFLELCATEPDAARRFLDKENVESAIRNDLITRYAKENRRLRLDLQHQWEAGVLSIRQRLQSELLESSFESDEAVALVDKILPPGSGIVNAILSPSPPEFSSSIRSTAKNIVINQQIIGTVQGVVAQTFSGTANLGTEATQLLDLVHRLGGADERTLESAVYELEDQDARPADRVTAKQRLKGFLFKVSGKVGDASLAVLQKYIEGKIGL